MIDPEYWPAVCVHVLIFAIGFALGWLYYILRNRR